MMLQAEGAQALKEVIEAVPEGIPVILDVKRGDIDTTAEAYAVAAKVSGSGPPASSCRLFLVDTFSLLLLGKKQQLTKCYPAAL